MPRIRIVLSFGLPDPDRLSTTLLWSLLGHAGLLVGMLIYQSLPSSAPLRPDSYFVRLAGSGGPPPGGGGRGAAAPVEPLKPIEKPPSLPDPPPETVPEPPREPPRPRPEPAKASLPFDKPAPAAPAPARDAGGGSEAGASPARPDEGGLTGRGPGQGPGEGQGGGGAGVRGTSFGEGDFRYGWYQSAIEAKLESMWRKPPAAGGEVQACTVAFTIRRNGSIEGIQISSPSGNSALDLSVMRAVYDSHPLPALPRGWSGDSIHVSMEFRLSPGGGP